MDYKCNNPDKKYNLHCTKANMNTQSPNQNLREAVVIFQQIKSCILVAKGKQKSSLQKKKAVHNKSLHFKQIYVVLIKKNLKYFYASFQSQLGIPANRIPLWGTNLDLKN